MQKTAISGRVLGRGAVLANGEQFVAT